MNASSASTPVAVAVSGGADSLCSLIRLQEEGLAPLALHGIFFTPRTRREQNEKACIRERLADICRSLGIPLTIADLSKDFLDLVIRPFVQAYADGLTPNPCALCNARIKFGLLQDAALAGGARLLATGHYARLDRGRESAVAPWPALVQGADSLKDQSYFLALTPGERLNRAFFPLSETRKQDVLQTLARRGIAAPQPGESQEVCFVPGDEYREYLQHMAEQLGISLPGSGPMLLRDGRQVGVHKGLWRYTEGQRRGLGIGWAEPLHVLGKETGQNILRLGPRREMGVRGCLCRDLNILLAPDQWPATVLVKTRYREKPKPASVVFLQSSENPAAALRIRFLQPENAVAPGQVAAVYIPYDRGNGGEDGRLRLVAGGIIGRAE